MLLLGSSPVQPSVRTAMAKLKYSIVASFTSDI